MNIQNHWNLYSNIQNSRKSCTFCKFHRSRRKSCKSRRNKSLSCRNSSVCNRIDKDNNMFLFRIRYGLSRRNRRGWKSKYPTDSLDYKYNNRCTRSRRYR